MSYLPETLYVTPINPAAAAFWAHCQDRRLAFQRCRSCGRSTHPPLPVCPHCRSRDLGWVDSQGTGRVFSVTWAHTAAHEDIKPSILPYNIVVVEFPALSGVRLISNVVDTTEDDLRIGDKVVLHWDKAGDRWLPRFRKIA